MRHECVGLHRSAHPAGAAHVPALVFIHGGCHSGSSWEATIAALNTRRPDAQAFAVDLPGRGDVAGDLASLTLDACVASVIDQTNARFGTQRPVVLIGHSMAGTVIPGVANRLGGRVRRVIAVDCCVPPAGMSIMDTLPLTVRILASRMLRKRVIDRAPVLIARFIFGNRASREDRARIRAELCPESTALIVGKVPEYAAFQHVPVGWIMSLSDRAMPPRRQRAMMQSLDGFDRLATIDAGHEVLITHPHELAGCILAMLDE